MQFTINQPYGQGASTAPRYGASAPRNVRTDEELFRMRAQAQMLRETMKRQLKLKKLDYAQAAKMRQMDHGLDMAIRHFDRDAAKDTAKAEAALRRELMQLQQGGATERATTLAQQKSLAEQRSRLDARRIEAEGTRRFGLTHGLKQAEFVSGVAGGIADRFGAAAKAVGGALWGKPTPAAEREKYAAQGREREKETKAESAALFRDSLQEMFDPDLTRLIIKQKYKDDDTLRLAIDKEVLDGILKEAKEAGVPRWDVLNRLTLLKKQLREKYAGKDAEYKVDF